MATYSQTRTSQLTLTTRRYIISVNASIVADSGGTCVCNDPEDSGCYTNEEYLICTQEIKRDLITATAAISAFASFFMGLFSNL